MADAPATTARLPIARLTLHALVILVGLGLFFAFASRTKPVVAPPEAEAQP